MVYVEDRGCEFGGYGVLILILFGMMKGAVFFGMVMIYDGIPNFVPFKIRVSSSDILSKPSSCT